MAGGLRRILRPFLKAVHPDVLHEAPAAVKRTNESSLQHLNTVIDSLEHLRRGQQAGGVASGKVETQYDLTFYYRSQQQQHEKLTSFNTRLLFSSTTISRLQQKSRDQAAAGKGEGEAGKKAALSWPAEISAQLRKLFDGAKLPVPKELEGGEALGSEGGRRRSAAISDKVALQMIKDDLYKRDSAMRMAGKGGSEAWKRLVDSFMRSGRVLTRGQMETLDEMAALSELQELLLKEAERLHFNDASLRERLLIVIDSTRDPAHGASVHSDDNGLFTITVPALGLRKTRFVYFLRRISRLVQQQKLERMLRWSPIPPTE